MSITPESPFYPSADKGEIWDVIHARKGAFTALFHGDMIVGRNDFVTIEIIDGAAKGITFIAGQGEVMEVRASFLTLVVRRPDLEATRSQAEPAQPTHEGEGVGCAASSDNATTTGAREVPAWLVHKDGRGWYRPDAQGYTNDPRLAGRYTEEDARKHSYPNGIGGPRDGLTFIHENAVQGALDPIEGPNAQADRLLSLIAEALPKLTWYGEDDQRRTPDQMAAQIIGRIRMMHGDLRAARESHGAAMSKLQALEEGR